MDRALLLPPLDGTVSVIPGFVDFHATNNASCTWAKYPSIAGDGITRITYAEFAAATHRVAHALRPVGTGRDGSVVALLLNCDVIHFAALFVGTIRAGFVPFPISPRNAAASVVNLLERTGAHTIVTQHALFGLARVIRDDLETKGHKVNIRDMPDFHDIFSDPQNTVHDVESYPTPLPRPWDSLVYYLHSSGSTGMPRPIPFTAITILDECRCDPMQKSRDNGITLSAIALPCFHVFGLCTNVLSPFVTGVPLLAYTPRYPASPALPTPQNVLDVSERLNAQSIAVVPAFVEMWAQSEACMNYLSTLAFVMVSGGPLSEKTGGKLVAAGVKLYAMYGSTEVASVTKVLDSNLPHNAALHALAKKPTEWAWMAFADHITCRWWPQGDDMYELHILTSAQFHPSVENLPDTRGYATGDLWKPHPTKHGLWRLVGRSDDMIVLATGEKTMPAQVESIVTSHPVVAGAVVFGRGKNQCGLLVEPRAAFGVDANDEESMIAFRNKLWPIIEEANRAAPAFARIFKEMILVTHPAKPLPRAPKGTIVRKLALVLYEREIQNLYSVTEDSQSLKGIPLPASWSARHLVPWLMQHAMAVGDGTDSEISPAANIFLRGFDSLHATFLRNRIIGALRSSGHPSIQAAARNVPQNIVSEHPTIEALSEAVSNLVYAASLHQ